jgi:hypothetical protein
VAKPESTASCRIDSSRPVASGCCGSARGRRQLRWQLAGAPFEARTPSPINDREKAWSLAPQPCFGITFTARCRRSASYDPEFESWPASHCLGQQHLGREPRCSRVLHSSGLGLSIDLIHSPDGRAVRCPLHCPWKLCPWKLQQTS